MMGPAAGGPHAGTVAGSARWAAHAYLPFFPNFNDGSVVVCVDLHCPAGHLLLEQQCLSPNLQGDCSKGDKG